MAPIQWLLIGGPAHGETLWVKHGGTVRYPGKDGKDHLYTGQNYLENGRLYRIGFIDPIDPLLHNVSGLIKSTGLKHIAGS